MALMLADVRRLEQSLFFIRARSPACFLVFFQDAFHPAESEPRHRSQSKLSWLRQPLIVDRRAEEACLLRNASARVEASRWRRT
jgi:hypothetical protein